MAKKVLRRCSIDGVEYPSITEAARVFGFSYQLVNARLRSETFPTWKLLGSPTRRVMGIRGTTFVVHGISYPKRTVAATALKVSESYISKLVDDPTREDCYRILPDGKRFKDTERYAKNRKTMLLAIASNHRRKAAARKVEPAHNKEAHHGCGV